MSLTPCLSQVQYLGHVAEHVPLIYRKTFGSQSEGHLCALLKEKQATVKLGPEWFVHVPPAFRMDLPGTPRTEWIAASGFAGVACWAPKQQLCFSAFMPRRHLYTVKRQKKGYRFPPGSLATWNWSCWNAWHTPSLALAVLIYILVLNLYIYIYVYIYTYIYIHLCVGYI